MSLIPQDIFNKIPNLYETENQEEKICYVKLFLALLPLANLFASDFGVKQFIL